MPILILPICIANIALIEIWDQEFIIFLDFFKPAYNYISLFE